MVMNAHFQCGMRADRACVNVPERCGRTRYLAHSPRAGDRGSADESRVSGGVHDAVRSRVACEYSTPRPRSVLSFAGAWSVRKSAYCSRWIQQVCRRTPTLSSLCGVTVPRCRGRRHGSRSSHAPAGRAWGVVVSVRLSVSGDECNTGQCECARPRRVAVRLASGSTALVISDITASRAFPAPISSLVRRVAQCQQILALYCRRVAVSRVSSSSPRNRHSYLSRCMSTRAGSSS